MTAPAERQDRPRLTFGPFRLDAGARTLERDGVPVPLLPRSFDVLLVLVRNAGRLLEKEFLLAEVWPDTHVEENSLARAISDIRKALGEGPKDSHFIVTVTRRGYRFAATVTTVPPFATPEVSPPKLQATQVPRRRWPFVLSGVALAAVTVIGPLAWRSARSTSPSSGTTVTRLAFTLPQSQSLSSGDRRVAAIAPDGRSIAYVAAPPAIYLRSLAALEAQVIRGTEGLGNLGEPVFSPDSQSLVFHASGDQTLKTVPVSGGTAVTLCTAVFPTGISWDRGGILFVEPGRGILRIATTGGAPQTLVRLDEGQAAQGPQLLPDGEHLLFTLATGTAPDRWDTAQIVVQSLVTGEQTTLISGGSDARYIPTGHLVYARRGNLLAVAFDARRLRVGGPPTPVIEGVRRGAAETTGTAQFSVAQNGSLMYVPGPASAHWDLGFTDAKGVVEPLHLPPGAYEVPRLSPDGRLVAFVADDGRETAVWTYEVSGRSPMQRLTFGGNTRYPTWSADSASVAFQSDREGDEGLFRQAVDGSPAERLTTPRLGESHEPEAWSPDGGVLLFSITAGADVTLWSLSLKDRTLAPFSTVHSSTRTGAVFSRDGRWVAYARSDESGKTVYVEPFPSTGIKHQLVATAGGQPNHPLWSPDGRMLLYNPGPGRFEAVTVTTTPTFAFGNPVVMPRSFPGASLFTRRPYDITPDGRILSAIAAGQVESRRSVNADIQVVLNWFDELNTRVPSPQ